MSGALQAVFQNLRSFAALGGGHWIGTLGGTDQSSGRAIGVDSSGNVYLSGYSTVTGVQSYQVAKYNSTGTIQWQGSLSASSGGDAFGLSIAVDSSGNSYHCGYFDFSGGQNSIGVIKYDTNRSPQWQRRLTNPVDPSIGRSVAVDSSGNVYVGGSSISGGVNGAQIAKYNSSGTLQWQQRLSASNEVICTGVALDSSANVYLSGYYNAGGATGNEILIIKYDTGGTLQWQRRLGGSADQIGNAVAVDSSGNVYVCGYAVGATIALIVAKYNTSGTIQWQRSLDGSGSEQGNSIAVDSSGNVYVCGRNTTGSNAFLIAKYNTSGTIQWQRILSGGDAYGMGIAVDGSNNFYICGYSDQRSGNNDFLFAKLPTDGTKTGTYVVGGYPYTYAASSLTSATSTLTAASASLTDTPSGLTSATSTMSGNDTNLTSSVTK
jgi:uncharacterized delta-60 repeat protein